MTKKNDVKTKKLTLADVPDISDGDNQIVSVPSFGDFEVTVRPLTVYEYNTIIRRRVTFFLPANENGDESVAEPQFKFRDDFDEACLVAAWCSLDPAGELVFGIDRDDAEQRVRNLHHRHREDIRTIHRKVADLSEIAETPAGTPDSKSPVEDAVKN